LEKVTSSIIREGCKIELVNKWINNKRTKWNEHVYGIEARKVRDWRRYLG
jgi:hypothetical protein